MKENLSERPRVEPGQVMSHPVGKAASIDYSNLIMSLFMKLNVCEE